MAETEKISVSLIHLQYFLGNASTSYCVKLPQHQLSLHYLMQPSCCSLHTVPERSLQGKENDAFNQNLWLLLFANSQHFFENAYKIGGPP